MPNSLLDSLVTALAATRRVVAGVGPDRWTLPTPCSQWTVADVTAHLVQGNRNCTAALRGTPPAPAADTGRADAGLPDTGRPDAGRPGGDLLAGYDAAAAELVEAFGADGALDRLVTVPFGTVPGAVALHLRITELLVHGWDVASATGQHVDVAPAVAEQELTFSERALEQLPADRSPFAPPQSAPADATALERLVALLGRRLPR